MILTRIARAAARGAFVALAAALWMPGVASAHRDAATEARLSAIPTGEAPGGLHCPASSPAAHHCCHHQSPAHAPLPAATGDFERGSMPAIAGASTPYPAPRAAVLSACAVTRPAARAAPPLYLLFLQLRN
jgi:hypothetical protein